jgi:long-chain acyl-CoA synthetase
LNFADVLLDGKTRLAAGDRSFVDAPIDPEAMCSLLFTSGTTAMSKGVMLCHRNITHKRLVCRQYLYIRPDRVLSPSCRCITPFENTVGYVHDASLRLLHLLC